MKTRDKILLLSIALATVPVSVTLICRKMDKETVAVRHDYNVAFSNALLVTNYSADAISVEHFQNQNISTYHTKFQVADGIEIHPASRLTEAVAKLHGIQRVNADRYEITVEKAQLFQWQEIDSNVIATIRAWRAN